MDPALPPEERAELLLAVMTLEQKVAQLQGDAFTPVPDEPECGAGLRHVLPIPALMIPTFRITNGPLGVAQGDCAIQHPATALPAALALGASFDPERAFDFGDILRRETLLRGEHEMEAPGLNMARIGQGGRNPEYHGEDPILTGTIGANVIRGIQSTGEIIGMAKHYAVNDQEQDRNDMDVVVDNRTLHELYLLPFEMAVKDGEVASIMCAYNRVNGTYACDHAYLLTTVLREQWGFEGYVQSDFGATSSTAQSLNAGEDLEMEFPVFASKQPGGFYTVPLISAAIADGSLTLETIDRALRRRYVQMFRYGVFDRPIVPTPIDEATASAHGEVARRIGEQSAVLLRNEDALLPLDASEIDTIALVGQATFAQAATLAGSQGARVVPTYTVPPLEGLQNVLTEIGSAATVNHVVVADDNSNLSDAVNAAASADVAIVMAGVVPTEGADRPGLALPNDQDALISAVAAANPNTVLLLKDGDPVLMPWLEEVPAVLEAWLPGQEDGNIVARLLFGLANPSGKLPLTYPVQESDTPTHAPERYPGVLVDGIPTAHYDEGLEMGYRWYDAQQIEPLFPFGYGLSYTSFALSQLEVSPAVSDGSEPILVQLVVENTGSRAGAEVVQVYLGLPPEAGEPPKRLVAFAKVWLDPGEQRLVQLTVDPAAASHPLSTWDPPSQQWITPCGTNRVWVGTSSRDLPLSTSIGVLPCDIDGDGLAGADDNCPFASNPDQLDSGGIATSEPDGIGDACQCGDVTGNGIVNGQDGNAIRAHGLGAEPNPTFAVPGNCDVTGNDICNGQDGNAVRRAALGLPSPLFGQSCHNATGASLPPDL